MFCIIYSSTFHVCIIKKGGRTANVSHGWEVVTVCHKFITDSKLKRLRLNKNYSIKTEQSCLSKGSRCWELDWYIIFYFFCYLLLELKNHSTVDHISTERNTRYVLFQVLGSTVFTHSCARSEMKELWYQGLSCLPLAAAVHQGSELASSCHFSSGISERPLWIMGPLIAAVHHLIIIILIIILIILFLSNKLSNKMTVDYLGYFRYLEWLKNGHLTSTCLLSIFDYNVDTMTQERVQEREREREGMKKEIFSLFSLSL